MCMKEILIVEDDITMNKMLSDLLVHEGYIRLVN